MIDADPIIARLKILRLFRLVGGAIEAAAAMDDGQALGDGPNAYVLPMADDANPPGSPGGPQLAVMTFGVAIMVRRHGDALGKATMGRMKPLEDAVLDGLMGWQIAPGFDACWWRGGRLLSFTNSGLWWLVEFAARVGVTPSNLSL